MNSWVTFLKQWSAEHNMPYGQALKSAEAKAAYNKAKGIKTGHKGAVLAKAGKKQFRTACFWQKAAYACFLRKAGQKAGQKAGDPVGGHVCL